MHKHWNPRCGGSERGVFSVVCNMITWVRKFPTWSGLYPGHDGSCPYVRPWPISRRFAGGRTESDTYGLGMERGWGDRQRPEPSHQPVLSLFLVQWRLAARAAAWRSCPIVYWLGCLPALLASASVECERRANVHVFPGPIHADKPWLLPSGAKDCAWASNGNRIPSSQTSTELGV